MMIMMDIGWMAVRRNRESRNGDQLCRNPRKPHDGPAHRLPDQPEAQPGNQQEAQCLEPTGDIARHAAGRADCQEKDRDDGDSSAGLDEGRHEGDDNASSQALVVPHEPRRYHRFSMTGSGGMKYAVSEA